MLRLFNYHVLRQVILPALCLLSAASAVAQVDEIEAGFKRLDAATAERLRGVLAQSVPQGVPVAQLRRHFLDKSNAAAQLGDMAQRTVVLRQAISLLPDPVFKNNLARDLLDAGQITEGNALAQQAIAAAPPALGFYYAAYTVCDALDQNQPKVARTALLDLRARQPEVMAQASPKDARLNLPRGQSKAAYCASLLASRQGKFALALAEAEAAEKFARQTLAMLRKEDTVVYIQQEVANTLARKLQAYRAVGRLQDAEQSLSDYIRFSTEAQLPPGYLSGIYLTAAQLRFSQREFAASEQFARKSDMVLENLGQDPVSAGRARRMRDVMLALVGQKKWPQALQELDRLDDLAGSDPQRKDRVLFRFERGLVYFGNQRYAQAALLFARLAQLNKPIYGESHFFVAQSAGMQGAALWRTGDKANQAQALPLLKAAVRNYMAAYNTDYLENIGLRKEIRDEVFAAYLEAVTSTPGEDPNQAMGPADWVRGSSVQDALADAAARAAASTPALAGIVRQEQDAKNEISGLRSYLAGDAGAAGAARIDIANQMRERIAELDSLRLRLQADIRAKFPDYESLVRPSPPTAQTVAQQLLPAQALVLVLPTQDAVYVWAVASDRPAKFAKAKVPEQQVGQLVAQLRGQLDFAQMRGAPKRYDAATAFDIYDKLLAPVASVLQGKSQLIVAASGALAQLPFAVLHTAPGGGADANAPWLIAQTAITQVPSLSAWLSIKGIAKARPASEPFIGWGDPVFSAQAAAKQAAAPTRSLALVRGKNLSDADTAAAAPLQASVRYGDMPALPDTRDELQAMAKILSANQASSVIVGAQATRESVLAASRSGLLARKRVVAFATHGLMAGDLPNLTQPALALSVAAQNKGLQNKGLQNAGPLAPLLTLEDVLTLKLNADWVVLSACNTAAADGKGEEALSGLARGFFYAGSRSLLVTHWSVETESATMLTTATLAHYTRNPQAPKAESLRQAMLKVMNHPGYSHPAYWAPYALVGDGGR